MAASISFPEKVRKIYRRTLLSDSLYNKAHSFRHATKRKTSVSLDVWVPSVYQKETEKKNKLILWFLLKMLLTLIREANSDRNGSISHTLGTTQGILYQN